MSDLRDTLYKQYVQDTAPRYPSGREGWETYLVDRIAELEALCKQQAQNLTAEYAKVDLLEAVAEAAAILVKVNRKTNYYKIVDALRAAGYLGVGNE